MATTTAPSSQTEGIDLTDAQITNLIRVLELVENAESGEQAVWLAPKDRASVAEIRREIEEQT